MKKLLLMVVLFLSFGGTTFAGGLFLINSIEKQEELLENLEYGDREKMFNYMDRYSTADSKYKVEVLKKKYSIGKYNEKAKNEYEKTKKETLEKIEKISKEFAKSIEENRQEIDSRVSSILLEELNIKPYIYLQEQNDTSSFYKKNIKLEDEGEEFSKSIKEVYIVKQSFQTEKQNAYEAKRKSKYKRTKGIYEKSEFQKLDSQKVSIQNLKEKGFGVDFLEEFSRLQTSNEIDISLFIEHNGLYISLNGRSRSFRLRNSSRDKLFFLERKYSGKDDFPPFLLEPSFPGNNNPLLEKKISILLEKLEKKLDTSKWKDLLLKLDKRLVKYNTSFKGKGLKIAEKINPKANIDTIFSEFKKFKYRQEVLNILTKQVVFKLKESSYDSALEEFMGIDDIELKK